MGKIVVSVSDPKLCRAISQSPDFTSRELFKAEANGHKFTPGETKTLTGLVNYPEYNGQAVKITAIRQDGAHGKAYYIEGQINEVVNWVYEYRLA